MQLARPAVTFDKVNHAEFLALVEARLKESGVTPAEASRAASGHSYLIYNLRRGAIPNIETASALCDALGLEFRIGPYEGGEARQPEGQGEGEAERQAEGEGEAERQAGGEARAGGEAAAAPFDALDAAVPREAAARLSGGRRWPALRAGRAVQRSARELVRLAVGLGWNPIPDDLWPVLAAHAGETLPAGSENVPGAAWPVDVMELEAAAGEAGGWTREEFKGRVWFRRGWLEQRGLSADDCIVIGVRGDSMEPTLPDGCSVLVDRSSTDWEPPHILVVRAGDSLVVKRAALGPKGARLARSDNPALHDEPWPEGASILGRIRWLAHGL